MNPQEAFDLLIRALVGVGGPAGLWAAWRAFRKSRREDSLDDVDIVTRLRKIAAEEVERAAGEVKRIRAEAHAEVEATVRYYRAREARLKRGVEQGIYPPWDETDADPPV